MPFFSTILSVRHPVLLEYNITLTKFYEDFLSNLQIKNNISVTDIINDFIKLRIKYSSQKKIKEYCNLILMGFFNANFRIALLKS